MGFLTDLWSYFHFRNPHSIGPVVIQSFMLLSSCLIILGLAYVFFLVLAIGIHHFCFDRDARKVPDYVKKSIQFSSESEGGSTSEVEAPKKKKDSPNYEVETILRKVKRSQRRFSGEEFEDDSRPNTRRYSVKRKPTSSLIMGAKRTNNLDKFMGLDIDMKKN